MPNHRFQILALDVDGTLLDPGGTLRPRTLAAVAREARAGIRPVLCTGRRYRRAWPIARQLELDAPLVCNSGAIIKDPPATLQSGEPISTICSQPKFSNCSVA